MAVLPRPLVGSYGSPVQPGFTLYDNSLDQLMEQGRQDRQTQAPQLQNQFNLGRLAADTERQGQQLQAQTTQRGQDVTSQGNQLAADTARRGQDLQFQSSMAPINFARDRFNAVFPMFQSALGGGGAFGQQGGPVGGVNTPRPAFTGAPVYTPQQQQQQINAGQAGNAARAATQSRGIGESAAARGMSSQSPLIAALQQQVQASRMAADADVARDVPFQVAQANADQRAQAEALQAQVWAQENELDIRRRQNQSSTQVALLNALAGLI